ncbi:MAG: hypothetical protein J5I93_14805 [Pirellulaceae bacterium]|nr:hypothetical protein [Pirellulaceae bacterium]
MFLAAICLAAVASAQHVHNLPPAHRLLEPGPGVGGPGPGVLPPALPSLPQMPIFMPAQSIQVLFNKPEGMQIRWDVGGGRFDSSPLIAPGRSEFPAGGIYRLKLTNIEGREGTELYPTIEVGPATPRTEAYLAHNAIPVQFTEEDFDQVMTGNFVTKVIYLPDPEFQQLALAGVDTLVSTRLDPGVDPIVEADRRGSIMAVVRLGNKDIESPGASTGFGGVMHASHIAGNYGGSPYAGAMPMSMGPASLGPTGVLPNYISGVTAPQWGMPSSGTPIGLPGPPHIPLGSPAGLQRHVMKNHTPMHIPGPVEEFKIHVRQQPGYSYPRPPSRMRILEQNIHPPQRYGQPHHDMHEQVH